MQQNHIHFISKEMCTRYTIVFPFFAFAYLLIQAEREKKGTIFFFYKMSFIRWYDKGGNISTSNCPLELLFSLSCCITTAVYRPSCRRISSLVDVICWMLMTMIGESCTSNLCLARLSYVKSTLPFLNSL